MAAFQDIQAQTEPSVRGRHLLSESECTPSFMQRGLASTLNIVLGVMNHYLKRCITKRWMRVCQISRRHTTYFLTPEGYTRPLSKLLQFTDEDLPQVYFKRRSLGPQVRPHPTGRAFFLFPLSPSWIRKRSKEKSCRVKDYLVRSMTFFRDARAQYEEAFEFCKIQGWLKIALGGEGELAESARLGTSRSGFLRDGVSAKDELKKYDAVIVTDMIHPQGTYEALTHKGDDHRVLTLNLLHLSKVAAL